MMWKLKSLQLEEDDEEGERRNGNVLRSQTVAMYIPACRPISELRRRTVETKQFDAKRNYYLI